MQARQMPIWNIGLLSLFIGPHKPISVDANFVNIDIYRRPRFTLIESTKGWFTGAKVLSFWLSSVE